MQLTRAADYAVRVMIHMAGLPPGTRASRSELAEAVDCPEQFLSKVLQSLTRGGLVASHRGNTGGFELPGEHRTATLLEVVLQKATISDLAERAAARKEAGGVNQVVWN